jgi:hypothetical protein
MPMRRRLVIAVIAVVSGHCFHTSAKMRRYMERNMKMTHSEKEKLVQIQNANPVHSHKDYS